MHIFLPAADGAVVLDQKKRSDQADHLQLVPIWKYQKQYSFGHFRILKILHQHLYKVDEETEIVLK